MKRLLVANRGEIAVRILCAAREIDLVAVAIYVESDTSHTSFANEAIPLPESSSFLDVDLLVEICKKHQIDAVHPGYGFLSESAEFATRLHENGIIFVGPSPEILEATGSKLKARELAEACHVPVLPALKSPAESWQGIISLAEKFGFPIMLKAIDGGGGRGIRLVQSLTDLPTAFDRAMAESPSRRVFAEKAVVDNWRHIEVQVLGDGADVCHFWERECSLQRRYQKIVEIAPSTIKNKELIDVVIESALKIARHIRYSSLGTFEFLVSPSTHEFYFMEINPRLQVEHTITEVVTGVDLVQLQLLLAAGRKFHDLGIDISDANKTRPAATAIQLRVTAEDVRRDFALSVGRINDVCLPRGSGVRVETHIERGTIVSADFDSLLVKVIVSGQNCQKASEKGIRALQDLSIEGVTTNIELLEGILLSEDFQRGQCSTQWLEKELKPTIENGAKSRSSHRKSAVSRQSQTTTPQISTGNIGSLKKSDAWDIALGLPGGDEETYHFKLDKILRNDFPISFGAEVSITPSSGNTNTANYKLSVKKSSLSSTAGWISSDKRRGDPKDAAHLICPLSGQLVEVLVDEGDEVDKSQAVAIIRQMKMELEVRAHRRGVVQGLWDVDDGENVEAGMLVCEILEQAQAKPKL